VSKTINPNIVDYKKEPTLDVTIKKSRDMCYQKFNDYLVAINLKVKCWLKAPYLWLLQRKNSKVYYQKREGKKRRKHSELTWLKAPYLWLLQRKNSKVYYQKREGKKRRKHSELTS
jgi:hypothetical protein